MTVTSGEKNWIYQPRSDEGGRSFCSGLDFILEKPSSFIPPLLPSRIWQRQTHPPFLPTASFRVPLILFLIPLGPFYLFSWERDFSPKFHRLLDCLWWKFTLTFVTLKSSCLENYIELEKKKCSLTCFSSWGFSPVQTHFLLCFKLCEFWFSSGTNLIVRCGFRGGHLLLQWLEKINESVHRPHGRANICLTKHSYS